MAAKGPHRETSLQVVTGPVRKRRPRRCRICDLPATPDNPLSSRTRHYGCGLLEAAGQATWNTLWARRHEPEFYGLLVDTLSRYTEGSLPPELAAPLLDRSA